MTSRMHEKSEVSPGQLFLGYLMTSRMAISEHHARPVPPAVNVVVIAPKRLV